MIALDQVQKTVPRHYYVSDLTFRKVRGLRNIWYIPVDIPNPGDYIHVMIPGNHKGYCGRVVTFNMADGSQERVVGPWHSNTDALYKDAGIDLRNHHMTAGIIASDKEVLHEDDGVVGSFNRIEKLAQKMADDLGIPLHYKAWTSGGGYSGTAYPKGPSCA